MNFHREELLYLARISEQGERFDEMVEFIKEMLKVPDELDSQDRNLISVAFKNSVSKRRFSLRAIDSYELKDDKRNMLSKKILIGKFRTQIDNELKLLCNDAIETANKLLEVCKLSDNLVFLYKMKADYYRYMCEYDKGYTKEVHLAKSEENYKIAADLSGSLSNVNPIKLGLFLNFSVFYYEIKNMTDIACEMAKKSFDSGIAELEYADENNYKEALMILQLFRDNLSLWAQAINQ